MAQGNTRAVPVEVSALRLRIWKRAKLRGGWDYRAGLRNKGGIVVVGVWAWDSRVIGILI